MAQHGCGDVDTIRRRKPISGADRMGNCCGCQPDKGRNVSLTKEAGAAGLTAVTVGLGWDVRTTTGRRLRPRRSALCSAGRAARSAATRHFIFFNNKVAADGSVEHTGDNLTGEGDGDDETIKVNVAGVAADVDKIVFPVSIYDADTRVAVVRAGPQRLHPRRQPGQRQRAGTVRPHRGRLDRDRDGLRRALPQRSASGSSAPSGRAMQRASPASPRISASTSNLTHRRCRPPL